jgi:NADPH:quinone reductase-like Zn-dependent oxidoreductase
MQAMVYEKYGPPEVLHLKEVAKPIPSDNEILIRIHATTVSSADCRVRGSNAPFGFGLLMRLVLGISGPRQPILGSELAGAVESIGKDVKRFQVGDLVFAFADIKMGCHAQYKCMPQDGAVVAKPPNLTFEQAAAMSFGGTTALHYLKKAQLQRGEKVLINGASGSVGTAAVQLAKYFGAHVTGVCSTVNLDLVKSLGADQVIDYTKASFTQHGDTYDVIVDTAGTAPYSVCKGALNDGGRLLLVLATLPDMLPIPWVAMTSSKKIIAGPAVGCAEDLRFLADLAEKGQLRPVIDRCFPFEQTAQAHRYVDTGRKKGNVVITLQHDPV